MILATLAYPIFGALHARQISAGDYGAKSCVSRRRGRTGDVEDGAI